MMARTTSLLMLVGCWLQLVTGWEHTAPEDFHEATAGDNVLVACKFQCLHFFDGIESNIAC
jgi:hypothetical protein